MPKSDGDRFRVEEDAITENPPTNKDDPDIVKVVIVNKAKISFLFTERIPDVQQFFESGDLELRVTMGKNWKNYIAVHKTPVLKHFRNFEFKRSTEIHFTRNLLLFSDALTEGINLRMTLGIALDKQTDVSYIPEADLKPYLSDRIMFPP